MDNSEEDRKQMDNSDWLQKSGNICTNVTGQIWAAT